MTTKQRVKTNQHKPSTKALDKLFKGIIRFFKSQHISSTNKNKLATLPWFLTIGQPESGKTALLANSNQKFIFAKKVQNLVSSNKKQCSWWVTKRAVFLDVPGHYLLPHGRQKANPLWQHLTKLLRRYHVTNQLKGIIVTLDAHDILTRSDTSNQHRITQIAQALHKIGKQRVTTPVYLILNKCDLIPGFMSFFSDQGKEFREQVWGFELDQGNTASIDEQINHEFNTMIKQLNEQLLWQLHHEVNDNKRPLIKSFPLHVEKLKSKAHGCIAELFTQLRKTSLSLSGVYLTSNTQYEQIDAKISSQLPVFIDNNQTPVDTKQSYFTAQLMKRIIQIGESLPSQHKTWQQRSASMTKFILSGLAIIFAIAYLSKEFADHVDLVSKASSALHHYQSLMKEDREKTNITTAIQVMNDISLADSYVNQESSFLNTTIFTSDDGLKTELQSARQYALYNIFIPSLKKYLSDYLTTHDNDPGRLYLALKIYLMLGDKIPLENAYVQQYLPQLFSKQNSTTFLSGEATKLVLVALHDNFHPITIDETLVGQARSVLNHLPTTELAYTLLFAQTANSDSMHLNQAIDANAINFDIKYDTIPAIYTGNQFDDMYNKRLPQIANEVLTGNAVLGKNTRHHNLSPKTLTNELKTLYIKEYAQAWTNAITHVYLKKNATFSDLAHVTDELSGVNSPALALLQLAKDNVNQAEILSASPELNSLMGLLRNLSNPDDSQLYQMFSFMRNMSQAANELATSEQPGETAVIKAKQALNNDADSMFAVVEKLSSTAPQPFTDWLQQLTDSYWSLLIHSAGNYINDQWTAQVLAPYRATISNQYPFKKDATSETSIADFNAFFAKDGILETFEEKYIFPFLNYQDNSWQTRSEVSSMLNIPKIVFTQLKRLAQIQAMYYAENGKSPYAQFTLRPIGTDRSLQSFDLSYGREHIQSAPGMPTGAISFTWPMDSNSSVDLTAVQANGQKIHKTFDGPWAWAKLINASASYPLQPSDTQFEMKIDIESHKTHFEYTSSEKNNPFAVGYLQKTWMPHWIFKVSN